MGINLVTYYNSTVTPQDDALIYENALPASGMIYGGNVTIKNANTLHITAGHGALCGRKFTIEEADIPVILTSSGTLNGRLYIHMDLSDTGSPISLEIERAASLTPVIQQSNVNINDGIYEINLATFQISTSTVSNLVNVAPFIKYEFAKEVIIAPVEKTSTASTAYAVGKHLIYNDILYRITTAISSGGQINPGVNVVVSETIQNQIEDINTTLAGKVNTSDIANNLTTTAAGKVLDARQGKALNDVLVPKANQAVIATRQTNLTASRAYKVGDQFIYNNTLYRATAAISSGGTINIGSGGNATTADNVTTQISNIANPVEFSVTSGYTVNRNICFRVGKIAMLSIGLLCPAGYNYGNYLHVANTTVLPKKETVVPATVIYGLGAFPTVAKVATDGKIYIFTTYDINQAAGGNNCDTSFELVYATT